MPPPRLCLGWAAIAAIPIHVVACELVTPLDGLSGGSGSPDRGDAALFDDASLTSGNEPAGGDGGSQRSTDPDAAPGLDGSPLAPDSSGDASPPLDGGTRPADAATGTDACVVTALVCDGKVHACNGIADDGCPSGVTIGAPGSNEPLGGTPASAAPFSDQCPTGQVLVGMGGSTGSWIDAIYGICGEVSLDVSTSTTPYTYSVEIRAGATLPTRGTIGSTDALWQATCGPNQAVVGVAGNAGAAMDEVTLSCAPLLITGSPGSFAFARGTVTALPTQGDNGGGSPFTPFVCPDPQLITLLSGGAGDWVNSLGVACAAPALGLVQ